MLILTVRPLAFQGYTILQIRCLAELACPVWNGALTRNDIDRLERIQKNALRVILGDKYVTYDNALQILDIPKLMREGTCYV